MSYYLESETDAAFDFAIERAPHLFRYLVLALGAAAVCAAPVLIIFRVVADSTLPVLLGGFGIALLAGSMLLDLQIRMLPTKLRLDNRRRVLVIQEDNGQEQLLGYSAIDRVGLRIRGRGRWIVCLIRKNGATFDLLRTNRRRFAEEFAARVQNFMERAKGPEASASLPFSSRIAQFNDRIVWRDPLVLPATVWIALLLAGFAAMGSGALLRTGLEWFLAAAIPGGLWLAFAIYLLYAARFRTHYLECDAEQIRQGSYTRFAPLREQSGVALESGTAADPSSPESRVERTGVARNEVGAVLYSFDMFGGLPQILLPREDELEQIAVLPAAQAAARRKSGGAGQQITQIRANLRAALRVKRLSLSGLGTGDALAVERWLAARQHR